jgi:hypothetical protein
VGYAYPLQREKIYALGRKEQEVRCVVTAFLFVFHISRLGNLGTFFAVIISVKGGWRTEIHPHQTALSWPFPGYKHA